MNKNPAVALLALLSITVPAFSTQPDRKAEGMNSRRRPAQHQHGLRSEDQSALARVTVTPGWATLGQVLPPGVAADGLQIGHLPTQADIKVRWPDGSIRFAIVTVSAPRTDNYRVIASPATSGEFIPRIPEAAVRFTMGDQVYSAVLPRDPSDDVWLSGPLVSEFHHTVVPRQSVGAPHPFLRVLFDVRCFADGQSRLDVTVENTLDDASASAAIYAVDISINGQPRFHRGRVEHFYLTRWRKLFPIGRNAAEVTPDFAPFHDAGALPRYLPLVAKRVKAPDAPSFDILQNGDLNPFMPAHGGRSEVAPYPDWTARYLVHKDPTMRRYVLAHGDLAGSWPVHIREPADGRLVSIDERPNFWLDRRADEKPRGDMDALGPLRPDNAHVPSLAYVPYLLTGDRYYADEMAFWANYVLLSTFQDSFYNARGGSQGLLESNEVRGFAWGLRNLADAAAYLPDTDPRKAHFGEKVANNLTWLDDYADSHLAPLGTMWENKRPENLSRAPQVWIATWEQNYLAWAIDHANDQGFIGGLRHQNRIAKFQLALFTHSRDFPREYSGAGVIAVGEKSAPGTIQYYGSFRELFRKNFAPGSRPTPLAGYYGVDARLMLMIALANGWPGAREAYEYLDPKIAVDAHWNGLSDLAHRAGWALALDEEGSLCP